MYLKQYYSQVHGCLPPQLRHAQGAASGVTGVVEVVDLTDVGAENAIDIETYLVEGVVTRAIKPDATRVTIYQA